MTAPEYVSFDLSVDGTWDGAAVQSRRDGALIGILLRGPEQGARIVPALP